MTKFFLYVGFYLIASSSAILTHLYFRLRAIGINKYIWAQVRAEYLRNRTKHKWPAWPGYLVWPLLVAGVVVFAIGVFRL